MSWYTRARNSVTGAVRDVTQTGLSIASNLVNTGLGGVLGQGMSPLPQQGMAQMSQGFGPQTNLENLMNLTGQQQPQISQTQNQGGGLI